jgi:molybdopterin-containing oxidoreductase family membrane subunit
VINSAVVIALVCYSGAVAVLAVDVGQPARAWFTFWYPNVDSMLTEVTFCITCYLTVLAIEYVPILLGNRQLREVPSFLVFEFELHKLIYVLAGVGTFLSFFHQGPLGGLYGVLRGRPFAFREGFFVWPSTFFLLILSAAAVGPSFIVLTTSLVEKLSGQPLVRPRAFDLLGRISGLLLSAHVLAKSVDTLIWINRTSPGRGFAAAHYYDWKPFGTWILFAEIVVVGLSPRWCCSPLNCPPSAYGSSRLPEWLVRAWRSTATSKLCKRWRCLSTGSSPTPRAGRRSERSSPWWHTAFWCTRIRFAICNSSQRSAN